MSQNNGPGLLMLVNSSVDFTGVSFTSDSAGIVTCVSTATMVSDLATPNTTTPAGVRCKTPHSLGNRHVSRMAPAVSNMAAGRALQTKWMKLAAKH